MNLFPVSSAFSYKQYPVNFIVPGFHFILLMQVNDIISC